jgi:hypothetical protein
MSRRNYMGAGVLAAALAVTGYVSTGFGSAAQQPAALPVSESAAAKPMATSEAAPAPTVVAPSAAYAAYADAATRNAGLARNITWVFGGKSQHGWALHEALVCNLVGTDATCDSPEFAAAVAKWQKANGIHPADGIVTRDVWLRMMKAFQSARTYDAVQCPQQELLQIEANEWWDPSRPAEYRYLRRDAYVAYKRMLAAARADLGKEADGYFGLISGHRSLEYQASLRKNAGNPSTASLAVRSPHFTGRAIDLYVGGEPVSTADSNRAVQVATPAYRWLAKNAHRFGFRPYFYEPWHWEYDPALDAQK